MSVSSPVSYQLLRLIKWRINGVIKGPNDLREGKIGLKGKMGAIIADTVSAKSQHWKLEDSPKSTSDESSKIDCKIFRAFSTWSYLHKISPSK